MISARLKGCLDLLMFSFSFSFSIGICLLQTGYGILKYG